MFKCVILFQKIYFSFTYLHRYINTICEDGVPYSLNEFHWSQWGWTDLHWIALQIIIQYNSLTALGVWSKEIPWEKSWMFSLDLYEILNLQNNCTLSFLINLFSSNKPMQLTHAEMNHMKISSVESYTVPPMYSVQQ